MSESLEQLQEPGGRRIVAVALGRVLIFAAGVALVGLVLIQRSGGLSLSFSVRLSLGLLAGAMMSSALLLNLKHLSTVWRRRLVIGELLFDQALVSGLAYLSGGAASGASSLYGVTCLAGGMLLGVPGAIVSALAGGVFYSLMVLLQQAAVLPPPSDQPEAYYALSGGQSTYYLVVNVLVLALVALLVSYLLERLSRTSGQLAEANRRADQAERMAALGRLSAGLAHEIRNPLSSIAGSVQILRGGLSLDEDRELCDIVLRESSRLEDLVSDMVNLAKPRRPSLEATNVSATVREVVRLAQQSGRGAEDVGIACWARDDVWVQADPAQLRQLTWNLVRNAVQASVARGEVRIAVDGGEQVVLSVEDDGVGIDSVAKERLFDAFFTTRSQGSGVGLAVVKRIADDHGFVITVESSEGEGARFEVELGASITPPSDLPPAA